MLQISAIKEKTDFIIERLSVKNFDSKGIITQILILDELRRKTQNELDQLLHKQNTLAKQIGDLYKNGKKEDADTLKNETAVLKKQSSTLQEDLDKYEDQLNAASSLNLLLAAIVCWNTVHLQACIKKLRAEGVEVKDEDLRFLSPLLRHHIGIYGQYSFDFRRVGDIPAVEDLSY